jgi:hypothetical protein
MFGLNWNDPTTLWLNLTNLGLGLIVLACLAAVGGGFFVEMYKRVSLRRRAFQLMPGGGDLHALHTPQLGLTMADGGEPVEMVVKPQSTKPKH